MKEPLSIGEMRRRAPLHYWAKADNARFSAALLAKASPEVRSRTASAIHYGSSTGIAAQEAFLREAANSLELILKAVIAQMAENARCRGEETHPVPATHNVVQLWRMAGLKKLKRYDMYRLVRTKHILAWSGRYGAPKNDSDYDKEHTEILPYLLKAQAGSLGATKVEVISFEDFDSLYSRAFERFSILQGEFGIP